MSNVDISASAKLVELSIGLPPNTKRDKKQSAELDTKHNSTKVHKVTKEIYGASKSHKEAKALVGMARNEHVRLTLPYNNSGMRLVTNAMLMEYLAFMNDTEQKFYECRDAFLAEYPDIVANAPVFMGSAYDPRDYVSADELASKFRWSLGFDKISDGNFIVDTANEQMAEINAEMTARSEEQSALRVERMVKEVYGRVGDFVTRLSDQLQPDKKVYNSLIEGARELCGNLKSMNLTNDPNLEGIRQELEKALLGVDAVDVRSDDAYRKDVKTKVDDILGKFNF